MSGKENAVLSQNLLECVDILEEVKVCASSSILLKPKEQLIKQQKWVEEASNLYRYFSFLYMVHQQK